MNLLNLDASKIVNMDTDAYFTYASDVTVYHFKQGASFGSIQRNDTGGVFFEALKLLATTP